MQTFRIARGDFQAFSMCLNENSSDPLTGRLMADDSRVLDDPVTLQEWVAPDVALVDIGANVGCFSLVFATRGHVVQAIEASPTNANLLSASVSANDLPQLKVHNVAVSDTTAKISFCEAGPFGYVASDGTPPRPSTTEVDAVALDDWAPIQQVSDRVFVKMDIEGHEIHALRGMRRFLEQRKLPPLFVESNGHCLNWFHAAPATLCRQLEELGYTLFRYEAPSVRVWSPQEPQIRVVENLLCVQLPDDRIKLPAAKPARSEDELYAEIKKAAAHPNVAQRAHLARTIAEFPRLANDPDVLQRISRLLKDPAPIVRQSMKWAA